MCIRDRNNPALFASVATFSGGGRGPVDLEKAYNGVFKDAATFNASYRLLFIGCGTLEGSFKAMKEFHEALTQKGINNSWSEPYGSHEWQVWRVHLYDFAQLLFK